MDLRAIKGPSTLNASSLFHQTCVIELNTVKYRLNLLRLVNLVTRFGILVLLYNQQPVSRAPRQVPTTYLCLSL